MKILKNGKNKKINIVATPIGNREDITLRAIKTLQESDYIYAEDTKVSSSFLNYLNVNVPLRSLHKFNEAAKVSEIIELINDGKNISIISDAGTPLINDPGTFIAKKLVENDIMLYPIVGASATSATMSINSFNSEVISYLGFVDKRSKEKIKILLQGEVDCLCLVSPHYIVKLIETLNEDCNRNLIIAKEITKLHETHMYLTTQEFIENQENLNLKGEFTIIINKKSQENVNVNVENLIQNLIQNNKTNKDIVKEIKSKFKIGKNEIYDLILKNKER